MPQTLVLSVGSDPEVSCTRDLFLRSAGYIVVSAISIKEAAYLFRYGDFDLVILCHTLPLKDRERLTSLIRASGSRIPIVCVSANELGEQNAFADATLSEDPVLFLGSLEVVLSRHARVQPAAVPAAGNKIEVASVESAPGSGADSKRQEKERHKIARSRQIFPRPQEIAHPHH